MNYDNVQSVQIILIGQALRNARREVRKTKAIKLKAEAATRVQRALAPLKAWADTRGFKGPHFRASGTNQLFVAIGASTVNVGYSNGPHSGEYTYPLHTVGRVKTIAQ